MYICIYVYICIYMCICMQVCCVLCIHMYMRMHNCIYVYTYIRICIWTYVYICKHTHTHIYIYLFFLYSRSTRPLLYLTTAKPLTDQWTVLLTFQSQFVCCLFYLSQTPPPPSALPSKRIWPTIPVTTTPSQH